MVQIRANEAVDSFLGSLKERAEVLDVEGKLLGYFEPVSLEEQYRRAASLFTDEEIQRSKAARMGPEVHDR